MDEISAALEKANDSQSALEKLCQFIGKLQEKIWTEVIKEGLVLQEKNIEFLVETLKIMV